jgi:hypothetical protein
MILPLLPLTRIQSLLQVLLRLSLLVMLFIAAASVAFAVATNIAAAAINTVAVAARTIANSRVVAIASAAFSA